MRIKYRHIVNNMTKTKQSIFKLYTYIMICTLLCLYICIDITYMVIYTNITILYDWKMCALFSASKVGEFLNQPANTIFLYFLCASAALAEVVPCSRTLGWSPTINLNTELVRVYWPADLWLIRMHAWIHLVATPLISSHDWSITKIHHTKGSNRQGHRNNTSLSYWFYFQIHLSSATYFERNL